MNKRERLILGGADITPLTADEIAIKNAVANAGSCDCDCDDGGGSGSGDTPLPVHFDGDFITATASIPVSEITAILESLPSRVDFIYEDGDNHGLMTCVKAQTEYNSRSETTNIEAEYTYGTINNETASFDPEMVLLVRTESGSIDQLSVIRPDGESTVVYIFDSIEGENAVLQRVGDSIEPIG